VRSTRYDHGAVLTASWVDRCSATASDREYLADPYNKLPAMKSAWQPVRARRLGPCFTCSAPSNLATRVVDWRWRMNAMSLAEEEDRHSVSPRTAAHRNRRRGNPGHIGERRHRWLFGWVGLVVPIGKVAVGPDFARLLPASAIIGGGYLLPDRTRWRAPWRQVEHPAGILTAVIGTPFSSGCSPACKRTESVILEGRQLTIGYPDRVVGAGLPLCNWQGRS